jgi:hypothetical protein
VARRLLRPGMHNDAPIAPPLAARLARQPQLCAQVERLLDEVENRSGHLTNADAAEDAIVERVRTLGQTALQQWAEQQVQGLRRPAGCRAAGKKNSAG